VVQILPGVTARLFGEEDGVGELQLRGPNLMLGYYRNPEATRACFSDDGWFRTGDLARWDGETLFIVGRSKDLIIRNGFKIQPLEVEAVLNAHPDVVQSAVLNRPAGGDDVLVAYVQGRPGGALSEEALREHSSARLASFKQPQRIVMLDSLPLLPSGKVNKAALAAL
jgi:acyl-CoA synthetase (AMP-forming)/AMP-acid ligase II